MPGRRETPDRAPLPPENRVVTYIIRRVIAAVALLFVVSVITFSIFYLVPRLAGASAESLATRYRFESSTSGWRPAEAGLVGLGALAGSASAVARAGSTSLSGTG